MVDFENRSAAYIREAQKAAIAGRHHLNIDTSYAAGFTVALNFDIRYGPENTGS